MREEHIIAMLEELDQIYAAKILAAIQKQETIDSVIPSELKKQLADIDAEFDDLTATVERRIAELEGLIKEAVIRAGASVKSEHLNAVYTKPRTSWENKLLEGFSIAHPEILQARKFGEPSVSIRKLG